MTYIYFEVKLRVILTHNIKYDVYTSNTVLTYKAKLLDREMYVSVTYIYFEVKLQVISTYYQKVR